VKRRRKLPIAVEMFWTLTKLRRIADRSWNGANLRAKLDEALIELAKCQGEIRRRGE